jgi:ABC-type sugar transport system permease subunit
MDRGVAAARRLVPIAGALTVGLVALALRLYAVNVLPIDFDEDDYLRAGQQYATGLQAGDPGVLLSESYRSEHPQLTPILTGLLLAQLPPAAEIPDRPTTAPPGNDLPEPHLALARTAQAMFGAASALALAVLSPLGGLWLAIHTWSIKYTGQVMLESVPAFFALVAVLAWVAALRAGERRRRQRVWLVGAAAAFGLACAGKYLYGVAGLAILADWLWRTRPEPGDRRRPASLGRWLAPVAAWLLLGIAVFFAANPYLWSDPVGRLWASLTYHGGYATSEAVQETGWPSWQPLVWLLGSVPFHDRGTFVVAIDLPMAILAAVGLRTMWRRQRVFALWLLLAFAFLVAWPTKWPQYLLVLSAPLSLSAGYGTRVALAPVVRWVRGAGARVRRTLGPAATGARAGAGAGSVGGTRTGGRGLRGGLRDLGAAAPWLLPGVVAFVALALVPLAYEALMSLTDLRLASLRDGIEGGVVREAVGGLAGQVPAVPFDLGASPRQVQYVGDDLLTAFQGGIWLGGNTSAMFLAFSMLWMVLSVGLQAALGIAVALVLERPGVRFAAAWRTLFILPCAIPEVVGAVGWRTLFHPEQGLLAQAVGGPVAWTMNPDLSLLVLLVVSTWMGFPLWMLVATAGLRTIPRAVHEAAELDGAGRWRAFLDVTLPLLLPLLGAAFIVRGIAQFNQFYLFYVLGPPEPTTTLATFSYYVFNSTSGPGLYSVSAAINVLTLLGLAVVVVWFLRWRARAERVAFA